MLACQKELWCALRLIYRPASEYSKAFVKQEKEYLPKESAEMTTELKDYF